MAYLLLEFIAMIENDFIFQILRDRQDSLRVKLCGLRIIY